jgi:hypothetical protein
MNPSDKSLLAELASVLHRCDPIPESAYTAAEAAFALASVEDGWELLVPLDPLPTRSEARTFRFGATDISVEVRLRQLPWGVRLDGLVTPATDLEVRWPTGALPCHPDAAGFFRIDELPNQPLRIRLRSHVTPWFWV